MNSVPLVLPVTLAASTSRPEGPSDASSCATTLVDDASSIANVSSVTYWLKNGQASPTSQQFGSFDALDGVVLGCEDGTLYLLRQNSHHTPPISIGKPRLSRSSSPASAHLSGRSRSRPRTPTSSRSPFSLTSRARVVSGISDEQAQAPKNYVDFDEEPEKLKELLRGGIRDSASGDRLSLSLDRTATAAAEKQAVLSKGLSSPSGPARRSEAKSLLSATHSPSHSVTTLPSPPSPSSPSSPSRLPYHLSLGCHIFPQRSGTGNAVVGLRTLANGRHFVCLRSHGYDDNPFPPRPDHLTPFAGTSLYIPLRTDHVCCHRKYLISQQLPQRGPKKFDLRGQLGCGEGCSFTRLERYEWSVQVPCRPTDHVSQSRLLFLPLLPSVEESLRRGLRMMATVQANNNYLVWQSLSCGMVLTGGTKSSASTRLANGWSKGPQLGSVSAPMTTVSGRCD